MKNQIQPQAQNIALNAVVAPLSITTGAIRPFYEGEAMAPRRSKAGVRFPIPVC